MSAIGLLFHAFNSFAALYAALTALVELPKPKAALKCDFACLVAPEEAIALTSTSCV